jgi:hypothetical protein
MIFEIGNEDPVIYTEEEILKEAKKFLIENDHKHDYEIMQYWIKKFNAIKICNNICSG